MSKFRVLVWQWGRRGAGPRVAVDLAAALSELPDTIGLLSLSSQSEQMKAAAPPACALPYDTYSGLPGYIWRLATIPARLPALRVALRRLAPDVAVCAMPAPLDLLMALALGSLGVPFYVVVHDADAHPGDGFPMQMTLQRLLVRRATGLVTLSGHIAQRLLDRGEVGGRPMIRLQLPPFSFGPIPPPPRQHGGALRLLFFGRLLPYKGIGLFADALQQLGHTEIDVRVVGQGPETPSLDALRAMDRVQVENRWVPETEIGALLSWADAIVLSYTEASQSGVAAAAIAARRWVVATNVGGLAEQLQGEPLARICDPNKESLAAAIVSLIDDPPSGEVEAPGAQNSWHGMAETLVDEIRAVRGA